MKETVLLEGNSIFKLSFVKAISLTFIIKVRLRSSVKNGLNTNENLSGKLFKGVQLSCLKMTYCLVMFLLKSFCFRINQIKIEKSLELNEIRNNQI